MEVAIDFVTVLRIANDEYAQAQREIAGLGPLEACGRSQRRHDRRLAAAADAPTLACKEGCSWCCHFSVDVRAVEVFRILDFVERHLSGEEQERIRREVEANRAVMAPLDEIERMQRNVKCPFLAEGRCSIYAARPQTCRNYHATDAAGCRQSFEEPQNMDIDPEFAPLVYQAGGAHVDGFSKALRDAGYDIAVYEMNTALAAAWDDRDASWQRFVSRQTPFAVAGDEVGFEFLDEDVRG